MSLRGKTEVRRCHHRADHGTGNPAEYGIADRPAAHRQSTVTGLLPRLVPLRLGLSGRRPLASQWSPNRPAQGEGMLWISSRLLQSGSQASSE